MPLFSFFRLLGTAQRCPSRPGSRPGTFRNEGRCGPESDARHSARGASAYSRALSRFECWQQHAILILIAAKAPRSCRTLTPATFVWVLCSRRGGRSAAVSVRMQESGSVAGGRHLAYDCGKPLGARHAARFQTRTHTQALVLPKTRKQQGGQRNDIHIALATPVTGARVVVLMRFLPGNCAGVGRRNGRDTD